MVTFVNLVGLTGNVVCTCPTNCNQSKCDAGIVLGRYRNGPTKLSRSAMFVPDETCECEECDWWRSLPSECKQGMN